MDNALTNARSLYLRKKAYVPLTPAAEEAAMGGGAGMAPPMGGGGMMPPPPPQQGGPGMAPPQGGMAPPPGGMPQGQIQIVPGPPDPQTGQPLPMDAATGFIVLDPQQGLEMDPVTGIMINIFTQEFFDPEGNPMDPNQAMQMIDQATAQMQGGTTPQGGAMQSPPPGTDPSMSAAPAGPELDPNGNPIDPSTGMPMDLLTGQPLAPDQTPLAENQDMMQPEDLEMFGGADALPGLYREVMDVQRKMNEGLQNNTDELNGVRSELKAMRNQLDSQEGDADVLLSKLQSLVGQLETVVGSRQ